jgi:hypothetical protein
MKNLKICLIGLAMLSFGTACKKNPPVTGTEVVTAGSLIDYKNSKHQLSVGYYRTWRDSVTETGNKTSMRRLPDSLDMVMVFPDYTPPENAYWNVLKTNYVPYLHTKGTKVIITIGDLNSATTTGGQDSTGYAAWAKTINDKWVTEYNLDGIDIDVESNPTGTTLTQKVAAVKALSKYFGPRSGTGKKFIYDTNQNPTSFFTSIYKLIDYTFLQAYGRSTSNLTSTFNLYAPYITPDKFLPGFSFYEENGSNWGDVLYPDPNLQSRCYNYARWQPTQGTKGGVFSYALDRDIPSKTDQIIAADYAVTKRLIKIMNP